MRTSLLLTCIVILTAALPAAAQTYPPQGALYRPAAEPQSLLPLGLPHVNGAQVVDPGMLRIDGGLEYGSGIQFYSANTSDFSSLRLLLGGGYGLMDDLEVGGRIAYESNSGELMESDWGAAEPVDDAGLDYLTVFGKYRFNNDPTSRVSGELFASFAGDNKIYYGMDGFDFGIKLLFSSDMQVGTLHGDLGWVSKGGESDLGGIMTKYAANKANYENIFTYGVGYEYPYRTDLSITGEIYGWQTPYDPIVNEPGSESGDNFLMFDLGAKYLMAPDLALNGLLGVGLSKGAPDFQLYLGATKMLDMGAARPVDYGRASQPAPQQTYPPQQQQNYPPQQTYPPAQQQSTQPPQRVQPPTVPVVSPQEQARQALERGNLAYQNMDYNGAAAAYTQAVQADPNNGLARFNLGAAYYQLGRYTDASREYTTAIQINPADVESHFNLGLVHYQLGDTAQAINEWQQTLRLDPNHATARDNLRALGAL